MNKLRVDLLTYFHQKKKEHHGNSVIRVQRHRADVEIHKVVHISANERYPLAVVDPAHAEVHHQVTRQEQYRLLGERISHGAEGCVKEESRRDMEPPKESCKRPRWI